MNRLFTSPSQRYLDGPQTPRPLRAGAPAYQAGLLSRTGLQTIWTDYGATVNRLSRPTRRSAGAASRIFLQEYTLPVWSQPSPCMRAPGPTAALPGPRPLTEFAEFASSHHSRGLPQPPACYPVSRSGAVIGPQSSLVGSAGLGHLSSALTPAPRRGRCPASFLRAHRAPRRERPCGVRPRMRNDEVDGTVAYTLADTGRSPP